MVLDVARRFNIRGRTVRDRAERSEGIPRRSSCIWRYLGGLRAGLCRVGQSDEIRRTFRDVTGLSEMTRGRSGYVQSRSCA
jgi:hypothetical protein